MFKREIYGHILIVAGIILFFISPLSSITGFAIAGTPQVISSAWFYIVGFCMVVFGLRMVIFARRALAALVNALGNPDTVSRARNQPYEDDLTGARKSQPYQLFSAKTAEAPDTLFARAESKHDAANIASHVIQGKALYEFRDQNLMKYIGNRGRSIYRENLNYDQLTKLPDTKENQALIETRDMIAKYVDKQRKEGKRVNLQLVKVGFASGEHETKEGRGWEREAHFDQAHKDIGVHFGHYNLEVKNRGRGSYNLHLIVPSAAKEAQATKRRQSAVARR